ncbi:hypothetical protein BpHYR1_013251 [Brachionus plicatilis]|uniref:Uncharacterized protein n=1 Tax=Brachionus plicatilis TaxID=10195 RepID=A0A3M7S0U6_BRAPC|nr:hypothetical protein BpHYR1_013251 [Brachionus plicatilis]
MSRRETALKARKVLEKYKNCNDIESGESDEEINNEIESENEDNADKIRICKENKSNIICTFCTKPICGVCLHEQKVQIFLII